MGSNPVAIQKSSRRLPALMLIAAVAAALLYFSFQSVSLDDFDSVSFALALNHFDISLEQPHPPGFTVYVAMGQLAHDMIPDVRAALTFVSAVAGAVGVAAMLWLGAELDAMATGLLAAIWLMVLPGYWLTSEIALSDVPGVTLIILAVACLWKGRKDWRWLAVGAAVSGLCLGLRPQNGIPVVIFGLWAVVAQIYPHPQPFSLREKGAKPSNEVPRPEGEGFRVRVWLHLITIFTIGLIFILIWFVPTISASGGLARYLALVQAHSQHVVQSDSLFGHPVDGAALVARIAAFGNGLLELVGGVSWIGIITFWIVLIGLVQVNWRSAATRLCALWLIIAAVQVFLLESLERPRLYLPFIPPLILLAAMGWSRVSIKRRYVLAVPLLLAGLFAVTTLPLARTLNREATPPIQAADYIAAHYPANSTIVVTQGSFRHIEWQLPAYQDVYLDSPDVTTLARPVVNTQPKYLVLMDRDDIWPEAYAALTETGDYVPIDDQVFSRDPHVFPQHSLVRMQVLTPIKDVTPDQLSLPASGVIQVGDPANAKYFGAGWYRVEDIGGVSARWTQQIAEIQVALPPVDMTLTLEAAPYPPDESVEIVVNGQSVGTLKLSGAWQPMTIEIPSTALAGHTITTIQLKHSQSAVPPDSNRSLAAAYRTITLAHK